MRSLRPALWRPLPPRCPGSPYEGSALVPAGSWQRPRILVLANNASLWLAVLQIRQPDALADIRSRECPSPLGVGELRVAGCHQRTAVAHGAHEGSRGYAGLGRHEPEMVAQTVRCHLGAGMPAQLNSDCSLPPAPESLMMHNRRVLSLQYLSSRDTPTQGLEGTGHSMAKVLTV